MKKNLPIIIITILVVIFVIVTGIIMLKPKEGKKTTPIIPSIDSGEPTKTEEPIKYNYSENINTDEMIADVIDAIPMDDKIINGITYKNINSVTNNSGALYNYQKYNGESLSSYQSNPDLEYLFKEDEVLIPSYLVLMDDTQNAFFNYNGELYYIPIIKCDNKDDERIVFKNVNLTIFKNNGKIAYNGNVVGINYNQTEADFENVFACYYMVEPDIAFSQMNMYKTNLDDNDSTIELMLLTSSNSDEQLENMCKTFIFIKEDGSYDSCVVPRDIGTNVGNFSNVFFKESNYSITNVSGEVSYESNREYYLFEHGFKTIKED